MCGIVGVSAAQPVNQLIYDALLLLQHRGQDSTGIATDENGSFHMAKVKGQVREAYRTRDMRTLLGSTGLGHVRYATRGSAASEQEAQPFYVNAPYGILLVHNGNLTNVRELQQDLFHIDRRHLNSDSDTELLVNVLANELQSQLNGLELDPAQVFTAVSRVHERVEGSYAAIALIAGRGLLAFRDPFGIRPLTLGRRSADHLPGVQRDEWMVSSESLVLESNGYEVVRDVAPRRGRVHHPRRRAAHRSSARRTRASCPCSFEYVYLARPDSTMSGISVYDARLRLGDRLADTVAAYAPMGDIDVVMPIPDSVAPLRDAARAAARRHLPRGVLQEPLRRPDVHHARAGGAQEERAAEAERARHRVQGQEHPHRRRLDRARHDQQGDRRHGEGRRREQGDVRLRRPARPLPARLRHQHADAGGSSSPPAGRSRRSPARSAPTTSSTRRSTTCGPRSSRGPTSPSSR